MSIPQVTVGHIVHLTVRDYLAPKPAGAEDYPLACKAAIVTRVVDAATGSINLQWFDDNSVHVERNVAPGLSTVERTWHWPERES